MRFLSLLLILACLACPKGPVPHDLGDHRLNLQIYDAETGEPLKKALAVELLFQRNGHTNEEGNVTLPLPYFYEDLAVEISARGYLTQQLTCPRPLEQQKFLGVQIFLQPVYGEWSPVIEEPGLSMTLDAGHPKESKVIVPSFAVPFPLQCRLTVGAASTLQQIVGGPWAFQHTILARFQLDARPLARTFLKPWRLEIPFPDGPASTLAASRELRLYRYEMSERTWYPVDDPVVALNFGAQFRVDLNAPGIYLVVAEGPQSVAATEGDGYWIGIDIVPMASGEGRLLPHPLPSSISQEIALTPYYAGQAIVRNQLFLYGFSFDRWESDSAVYRRTIPLLDHENMTTQNRDWYQCGEYLEIYRYEPLAKPNDKASTRSLLNRYFILTGILPGEARPRTPQ